MSGSDDSDSAREHVLFLSGSSERLALLSILRGQSLTLADLAERADVSVKTTRNLMEAGVERSWITQAPDTGRYELTVAGDLVVRAYLDTLDLSMESLRFLSSSETRLHILDKLENESFSATALSDQLPVAVPTVYRALHSLEDRGLVNWDDTPTLTPDGEMTYVTYRRLGEAIDWATEHAAVLNLLSDEIGDRLPIKELTGDGQQIVTNSMADPDTVLNYYQNRLSELSPERIRGILPSMCARLLEIHQPLIEDDVEFEVITDEAVIDVVRDSYPRVSSLVATESIELFISPEKLQFGLVLTNGPSFVFIYDEQCLFACLETMNDAVGTRLIDVFETHRQIGDKTYNI